MKIRNLLSRYFWIKYPETEPDGKYVYLVANSDYLTGGEDSIALFSDTRIKNGIDYGRGFIDRNTKLPILNVTHWKRYMTP